MLLNLLSFAKIMFFFCLMCSYIGQSLHFIKFCNFARKEGRKLCLQWSVFCSFQNIDQVSFISQTTFQRANTKTVAFFPFAVCDLLSEIDYVEMQQLVGLVLQNFLVFIFFLISRLVVILGYRSFGQVK